MGTGLIQLDGLASLAYYLPRALALSARDASPRQFQSKSLGLNWLNQNDWHDWLNQMTDLTGLIK